MTMETITMVWSIFGFLAFISVLSLRGRVSRLERQLRNSDDSEPIQSRTKPGDKMQEYIGKRIIPDFYEDEEDIDILTYARNPYGGVTVIDCDEKWVLVRIDIGKKFEEKLIRKNSIKSITTAPPNKFDRRRSE